MVKNAYNAGHLGSIRSWEDLLEKEMFTHSYHEMLGAYFILKL